MKLKTTCSFLSALKWKRFNWNQETWVVQYNINKIENYRFYVHFINFLGRVFTKTNRNWERHVVLLKTKQRSQGVLLGHHELAARLFIYAFLSCPQSLKFHIFLFFSFLPFFFVVVHYTLCIFSVLVGSSITWSITVTVPKSIFSIDLICFRCHI